MRAPNPADIQSRVVPLERQRFRHEGAEVRAKNRLGKREPRMSIEKPRLSLVRMPVILADDISMYSYAVMQHREIQLDG